MRLPLYDGWVDLETGDVQREPASRLSPTELKVLAWLAARPFEIVSPEQLLRDVWGYNARVRTRTVSATLHRMRVKLEADPSAPRHLVTVRGQGVRFEPVEAKVEVRGDFVGRKDLIETLLTSRGMVALVGWGGVGKTRLVRELLDRREGTFCDLAACFSTDEALRTIAWTLGVRPDDDVVGQLADVLPHRGLVVLDNLEQIPDLDPVLARWNRVQDTWLVLTSRRAPEVDGLALVEVPPLTEAESEALLRARGVNGPSASLRRVGALLDGNPLALELAARRLELLTVHELLERSDRLDATLRTGPGRRDSLTGVVGWSLDHLDPDAQRAAFQLAQMPPTVLPLGLAEAVAGDLQALGTLQQASLLRREPRGLRLPVPIHAALAGRGDRASAIRVATDWALGWAEPLFAARDHEAIQRELPALTSLFLFLGEQADDPEQSARLGACAVEHLYHTGELPLALALADRGIDGSPPASRLRRRLRIQRARVLRRLGRADEAASLGDGIVDWPGDLAFDGWQAVCSAHLHRDDIEAATRALERADALNAHALPLERALLAVDRATLHEVRGQHAEGYAVMVRAWEELRDGPAWYRLIALNTLGNLALRQGRRNTARSWLLQALELARSLGPHMAGVVGNNLASLEMASGDLDAAVARLEQAARDHRLTGQTRGEAFALFNLGRVRMLRRDWTRALPSIEAATARFERNQIHRMSRWSRAFLAIVLAELGEIEAAQAELEASGATDAVGALAAAHLARAGGRPVGPLPTQVTAELRAHVDAFARQEPRSSGPG